MFPRVDSRFNLLGTCHFKWLRVAETTHPTTIARLNGRSLFSGIGVNQCLASRNIHGTFKQLVCANSSSQSLSLRRRPGRCGSPCERVLAADDPAVLDHALNADNTRVDRGDPAIAVLSIGDRPLGSRPRAAAGAQRLRASIGR